MKILIWKQKYENTVDMLNNMSKVNKKYLKLDDQI